MAETRIDNAVATTLSSTVTDASVGAAILDQATNQKETRYTNKVSTAINTTVETNITQPIPTAVIV